MSKEKYSIPVYLDGEKLQWTVDGEVGDAQYIFLSNGYSFPDFICVEDRTPISGSKLGFYVRDKRAEELMKLKNL